MRAAVKPEKPIMTGNDATRVRLGWTAGISLAAVVLADWLFYEQPLGWTLGLYALLLLGVLLCLDRGRWLTTFPGFTVAAATVGLVISLFYQPGTVGVLLTVAGLVTFAMAWRCGWTADAWNWAARLAHFAFPPLKQLFDDIENFCIARKKTGARLPRFVVALLKATPVAILTIVFICLFAAANPVISGWLKGVAELFDKWKDAVSLPSIGRLFMWAFIGGYCWQLLRHCPTGHPLKKAARNTFIDELERFFVEPKIILLGLALFNVIFAVQNLLDIGYLWGGASLPEGMTYAAYAHRGAYPLVVTALLAAAFVLATFRQDTDARHGKTTQSLACLWIAQNVFLTVSAGRRLILYVEVYHLTQLRVAAAIWILLVALGLVWICVRIVARKSNGWLVNVNLVTLLVVFYACAFINFSGFIAWYNCRNSYEVTGRGANVDFTYIRTLGPEAIPALQWVQQASAFGDNAFADQAAAGVTALERKLDDDLRNWRGWTWRRHRLRQQADRAVQ